MKSSMFVVSVISNASRYKRRPELYHRFKEMVEHEGGMQMITVELAFGTRPFECTNHANPFHIQLRSFDEFFHKENLINIGISHGRRLMPHANKVAWIDADCRPCGPAKEWFHETAHQLEHYQFVQMWQWLQNLDNDQNPLSSPNPSFMNNYMRYGTPYPTKGSEGYPKSWGSPGLAWAANIDAIDKIGGIPDVGILGAGDWYLAHMLTDGLELKGMEKYSDGYRNYWLNKQKLCERYIRRDVGVVPGMVMHEAHGRTKNRGYDWRERILIENQYDPNTDIKRDHAGVYIIERFEPRQIKMYDEIRAYFAQRNEDEPIFGNWEGER